MKRPGNGGASGVGGGGTYFWSLMLENVRCFGPQQTLELNDDGKIAKWTVILGDNGVGKTTLLQCLMALEPIHDPDSDPPRVLRSFRWPAWPGSGTRSVHDALARRDGSVSMVVQWACDSAVGSPAASRSKIEAHWHERSFDSQYPSSVPELFSCAYGASRKPSARALFDHNASGNVATLFDEQATLLGAEEWFLQSDYAAASTQSPAAIARSQKIRETLIDLLPDVEELRVVGLDQQPPRPALEALTPYGWVRLRDLSLGYRTLMAWVVDFAARMFSRYPDSADPLAEPAVCLVDEIDLHLHPTWQRRLIEFLDKRFPNTQFIVTAHSPLVVQATEQVNIVVLRRHKGDDFVTIHNDLDAVRGWRVDQILTSDLFGLEGSRAPDINGRMQERAAILRKPELDSEDRERLATLEAELASLPHGDTPEDRKAWDLVRHLADKFGKEARGA